MFQEITIVGNLGRDPELRHLQDGTPVANFSVASNRNWTNSDGTPGKETVWFQVTTWRRQAEVCAEYLTKGRQVLIQGRLNPDAETGGPRIWTDRNGNPRASYDLTAYTVKFLGSRNGNGGAVPAEPTAEENPEEIPF